MPVYIQHMRFVRGFSFFTAIIYNWMFSIGVFGLYSSANLNLSGHMTTLELLFDMFFAFNLIMNGPIFFMNIMIILKEVQYEIEESDAVYWD